jgi:starch-binding outer membrane protein, SusD/RagB family
MKTNNKFWNGIALRQLQSYTKRKMILPIFAMVLLMGCDSFVETDPPSSQLSSQAVFQDSRTANAALAGIYSSMRDNGVFSGSFGGLSYKLGLYADELDNYDAMGTNYFFNNSLFADYGGVYDSWLQSYSQLYAINAVIEGVNSSTLNADVKNQLSGEALFLRALIQFYLINLYGDVPYVDSTDYRFNATVGKMPQQQLTARIIEDLEQSIGLLPEEYMEPGRIRANKYTAYALLARVKLYNGKWAEAADAASAVINSNQYTLALLQQAFLKDSQETIWQLMPNGAGNNTAEGQLFIFIAAPPPNVALSNSLIAAFEPGDLRRATWTGAVSDGASTWYHPFKYKENSNTGETREYSVLFRLAEQYLIRGEARAMQGDIIGAQQDLNIIRNRAGLPDTQAFTQESLLAAFERERRVELFTELGHRFFDLKRTGRTNAVLGLSKPGWDPNDVLWPLPAMELNANPNLNPQNPGY